MEYNLTTPRAYREVIRLLNTEPERDSRVGGVRERLGVTVRSPDPRERWMSREKFNLPFALQETFAYWQGLNPGRVHRYNSNMEQWLEDGELPGSAYGDRLRNTAGHDQLDRVERQLRQSKDTRRAVAQVHQASVEDYNGGDVACTNHLHFFVRDNDLHLHASIRSQDMFWGYVYDTQNNQALQEMLAGRLGLGLGEYVHTMESAHFYTEYEDQVMDSLGEMADHGGPHASRDMRLKPEAHNRVMDVIDKGLDGAVKGRPPEKEFQKLSGYGSHYRDHLAVMAAYEAGRFHDDLETARRWAQRVDDRWFRSWTRRWLDGDQF